MHHGDLEHSASMSFSDIPLEEGITWVKKFRAHSAPSFACPLKHAGFLDVPVSFLLCEEDRVIPQSIQRGEIEMIEQKSGNKVDVTTLKTGHCPSVSNPQAVIDWLVTLATNP